MYRAAAVNPCDPNAHAGLSRTPLPHSLRACPICESHSARAFVRLPVLLTPVLRRPLERGPIARGALGSIRLLPGNPRSRLDRMLAPGRCVYSKRRIETRRKRTASRGIPSSWIRRSTDACSVPRANPIATRFRRSSASIDVTPKSSPTRRSAFCL